MALLNSAFSPIILAPGAGKDSRWLTLEVCREFARSKCSRTHEECKYAHPPPHVEIQNGRVMCCFDSLKGKCQRKDPPCKYLHPPQHLKEILLQNGRQNLILKNLQMQTTALQPAASVVQLPGVYPIMSPGTANRPYLMPTALGYTYYSPQSIGNVPTVIPTYESGGMLPISMTTNQLVGSFSGTSVPAVTTNGLTQHLIESTPPVNKQLTENSVCASSPGKFLSQHNQPSLPWEDSASPSNSVIAIESTNLPYCQPFFYKNRVMEVMTAIGRKRSHDASSSSVASADDLILGVNGVPGIVPVLKRPALVDPKSGLPFYGQYAGTTAYSATPAINALHLQQPRTQFLPFTISGTAPVIPRIN